MPIKAVIFDLDGTLVEFKFRIKEAKRDVVSYLLSKGITGITASNSTLEIVDIAKEQKPQEYEQLKDGVFGIYEKYEHEALQSTRMRSFAIESLRELKKMGLSLALVTNSGKRPATEVLEKFCISKFFASVITRDDVSRIKPDGEGIKKALFSLGASNREAVYVGDGIVDIKAARDAEVREISITNGSVEERELRKESPWMIISSLEEIPKIVRLQQ